jgi:hypothetical protein
MVDALGGQVSDGKLRLFACACCRVIWGLFVTELQRRTVEYVEWFARGPGCELQWLGTGNWTRRRLSQPIERVERTEGWTALQQDWQAYYAQMDESTEAFNYDNCTPDLVAGLTLDLSYQFPYCVPRGVAVLGTAPFAYWQHAVAPELSSEQQKCWNARIAQELTTYCDILRQVYGEPDLA